MAYRMVYRVDFEQPRNALERTMAEARLEMIRRGYRYHTMYEATRHWRHLAGFAAERGEDVLTAELAAAWLARCEAAHGGQGAYMQGVTWATRILTDYHLRGHWDLHARRKTQQLPAPPALKIDLDRFLEHWRSERRVARNTLVYAERYLKQWLAFLHRKRVTAWTELREGLFTDFFAGKINLCPGSLALIACVLKAFLKYLFVQGSVDRDWTGSLPRFRWRKRERIPSVWTPGEVEALLASVDRASAVGKRDYAILLLACRLGMRTSDIRTLRLDELCWEHARIEFEQAKTGRKAALPLTEEVGGALIDYLRHGRPISERREVFLRCNAPYEPFGQDNRLHNVVTKYRQRAGITMRPEQARGMHSLRHTVATRMLSAGIALETISEVLGHASLDTTRMYAKVDIAALRQVALGVEEASHAS